MVCQFHILQLSFRHWRATTMHLIPMKPFIWLQINRHGSVRRIAIKMWKKTQTFVKNDFFSLCNLHTGSITYLGKLFGSLVCGFASEQFGRRNSMLLINIPLFITFGLYYYSDSVLEVFIASVLLGFTTGFMKAPTSTYISELWRVSKAKYAIIRYAFFRCDADIIIL